MYPIIFKCICPKGRMGVKNPDFLDFNKKNLFAKIDKRLDSDIVDDERSFTILIIVLPNQIWQPI